MVSLNGLTAKLHCKQEATAFLISEDIAITARHAVSKNITENTPILLEFFVETCFKDNKVGAKVLNASSEFDIAILKLDLPSKHITDFISLSSQKIDEDDKWEAVGFPLNWNDSIDGSDFCYLKGDIYQIENVGKNIYDIHLSSEYIKENWEYDLKGLSGSPIIIDKVIKGIIIAEEYSLIKSPIKAISINKAIRYFQKNGINISSNFGPKTNLVNERLDRQKINCENLFKKHQYKSENIDVNVSFNTYHINYDDFGNAMTKALSSYLTGEIIEYACTLNDIYKSKNSNTSIEMFQIFKKTNEIIEKIKKSKKLGSLLIWMLLEGVIGAPKAFKRFSINDENIEAFNEVHIGMSSDQKLILYLGDGTLTENFKSTLKQTIEVLKKLTSVQEDIYIMDEYIYEQMDDNPMKAAIAKFNLSGSRNWDDIIIEISFFTGYDSMLLKKLEEKSFPKAVIEKYIEEKYTVEWLEYEEYICELIKGETELSNVKINWFTLPFKAIDEFEEMIIEELNKAGNI
ncbi:MAG: Hachiman antiphage defense system protein HamA [Bacillota bacterium]